MIPFEYLEHTADVKFRAYGGSPEEMLSNAAMALFNAMIDTSTVEVRETWKVELSSDSLEHLAYGWLSELVFLFETESAAFSTFEVRLHEIKGSSGKESAGWKLLAEVGGEKIDQVRHSFENEVKAITLHQFGVKKNNHWCLQVVLDV
jgi:SHS2 domain-containing protein